MGKQTVIKFGIQEFAFPDYALKLPLLEALSKAREVNLQHKGSYPSQEYFFEYSDVGTGIVVQYREEVREKEVEIKVAVPAKVVLPTPTWPLSPIEPEEPVISSPPSTQSLPEDDDIPF